MTEVDRLRIKRRDLRKEAQDLRKKLGIIMARIDHLSNKIYAIQEKRSEEA